MSSPESKRLAGMGLPTAETNPILQRQKEFGSKGGSSGMTFKKPFANPEKAWDEEQAQPTPPPVPHQEAISLNPKSPSVEGPESPYQAPTPVVLTDEQILAMAKERGLELQPKKIKYVKHTYSVTAYNHEMLPKISVATGITIQELMREAMDHVIAKYYASYEYSLKAPNPKKRN